MNQSESIIKIAAALLKVQSKVLVAEKDGYNPFHKSDYSTLEATWRACNAELKTNKITVFQGGDIIDGKYGFVTLLIHESGEWLRSVLPIVMDKETSQSLGSAITYLRRYSLAAAVGIFSGDIVPDDDAEGAMDRDFNRNTLIQVGEHKGTPFKDLDQDYLEKVAGTPLKGLGKDFKQAVADANKELTARR